MRIVAAKQIAVIIALCLSLSGCVPMALFASGSKGYKSSLGVQVASSKVNTVCLSPTLRLAIWEIEGHFGKKSSDEFWLSHPVA